MYQQSIYLLESKLNHMFGWKRGLIRDQQVIFPR